MQFKKYNNVRFALEANGLDVVNKRSELMISIEKEVASWKLRQGGAAKRLGLTLSEGRG